MGACTFALLNALDVSQPIAVIAGGIVVIATRVVSIKFDLHLPKFAK
jgi:uncharacterized membrane protein YeiH